MTSARASVMVMPAAAMSHLPVDMACPVSMVSNGVLTMSCLRSSFLATRSIRSTSKPTIFPPSWYWKGS